MQAGLETALPDVRLKFRVQFLQFFRLHALLCFQQAEARRIQHVDAVMNQQLRIARRVLAALDFLADFTRLQLQVKQRVQQRRFAHAALPRQTAAVRPAHQRPNAIQPFLVPRADTQHRAVRPTILLLHLGEQFAAVKVAFADDERRFHALLLRARQQTVYQQQIRFRRRADAHKQQRHICHGRADALGLARQNFHQPAFLFALPRRKAHRIPHKGRQALMTEFFRAAERVLLPIRVRRDIKAAEEAHKHPLMQFRLQFLRHFWFSHSIFTCC